MNSRDDCPVLKFNKHSSPHIAFRQRVNYIDSLKIYTYDSLNNWVMKWAIHLFYGSAPSLDLEFDKDQYPHIAFKRDMQSKAYHCYKDATWHMSLLCDSSDDVFLSHLGLEIDKYNVIHAVYSCDSFTTGFFKHG